MFAPLKGSEVAVVAPAQDGLNDVDLEAVATEILGDVFARVGR